MFPPMYEAKGPHFSLYKAIDQNFSVPIHTTHNFLPCKITDCDFWSSHYIIFICIFSVQVPFPCNARIILLQKSHRVYTRSILCHLKI